MSLLVIYNCLNWILNFDTILGALQDLNQAIELSHGRGNLAGQLPGLPAKGADGMTNSVDLDQTAPKRSSLIWVCTVCQSLSV